MGQHRTNKDVDHMVDELGKSGTTLERALHLFGELRKRNLPNGTIWQMAGAELAAYGIILDSSQQPPCWIVPRASADTPPASHVPRTPAEYAQWVEPNIVKALAHPVVADGLLNRRLVGSAKAMPARLKKASTIERDLRRGSIAERVGDMLLAPAIARVMVATAEHGGDFTDYAGARQQQLAQTDAAFRRNGVSMAATDVSAMYRLIGQPKEASVVPLLWRTQLLAETSMHGVELQLAGTETYQTATRKLSVHEVSVLALDPEQLEWFTGDDAGEDFAVDASTHWPLPEAAAADAQAFIDAQDASVLAPVASAVIAYQSFGSPHAGS